MFPLVPFSALLSGVSHLTLGVESTWDVRGRSGGGGENKQTGIAGHAQTSDLIGKED